MEEWISKDTLLWVSTVSGVGLLVFAIAIPWLIIRMPDDFFSNPQRYNWLDRKPATIRILMPGENTDSDAARMTAVYCP